ncbi:hypothetical protein AB4552_25440, partial [Vibrio sp. 10N.222.54.C3]
TDSASNTDLFNDYSHVPYEYENSADNLVGFEHSPYVFDYAIKGVTDIEHEQYGLDVFENTAYQYENLGNGFVQEPNSILELGLYEEELLSENNKVNYESSDEEEAVERAVNDLLQSLEDEDLGYDLEEAQSFQSSNDEPEQEQEIESTATFKKDEQVEISNDPLKNDCKEPIEPLNIKDLESDLENEIANSISEEKPEQNKKQSRKSGLRR